MSSLNSVHNYEHGDDYVKDPDPITLISKLDISDPLHLHPNDSTALTVVSIKLKGTENYQVWSCAMLLALEVKNKTGFIDGSSKRSSTDEVLGRQWDGVNAVVFGMDLEFNFRGTFLGSSIADYYHKLNALWKHFDAMIELLRCVCNASEGFKKRNQLMKLMQFLMGLDDSYIQIRSSILSREVLPDVRSAYATISSEESHRVASSSIAGSSQRNQAFAFVSNVPNKYNFQRNTQNLNNGPRPNNLNNNKQGANQHMTYTDKELDNVLDISHLKIKVGPPNGTEVFISKIGNLKLSNGLILYDVLVIPEYCVTLIFVHKLAKENKIVVAFDESKCYFLNRDLSLRSVLGTGNQCEGLGHHAELVLNVFKKLPSSVQNGKSPYEMIYNKYVNHIIFFDVEYPEIPNDDERVDLNLNSDLRSQSESNSSSESGNGVNTADFPVNNFGNDTDSSNDIVATQNEEVATLEENMFSEEMDALLKNGTWEIVELPEGRKDIRSKWIYKIKYRSSGEIDRYKARLVAQGFGQKEDFEETVYMKPPEGYFPSDNKMTLSLVVIDTEKGICLNQREYVLELLSEYGIVRNREKTWSHLKYVARRSNIVLGTLVRTKKYEELSVAEKLQADCDLKATNIVLQGLPPDVYAIVNHHKVAKEIRDRVKLLMQGIKLSLQEKECKLYDEFDKFSFVKGETLLPFKTAGLLCNKFKGGKEKVMLVLDIWVMLLVLGEIMNEGRNAAWFKEKAMLAEAQESGQILDEEQLAFLANPGILDDIISEVPHFQPYHTDMDNESVHVMQSFKQIPVIDFTDNEITSDTNIILYSQYLQEKQPAAVQDTNFAHVNKAIGFYNDTHKQPLGYQNPFYLKKAHRIKPTLYHGSVISSQHAASPAIDDEETFFMEEVSRSKMLAKQNDPMLKEKKVNTTPINYVELNRLSTDFGKHFVPQQELSDEQAFWLQTLHLNTDQSALSPVKIEALKEIPKKGNRALFDDYVNVEMHSSEFCVKCLDLDAELLNKENAYNDLSKKYFENNDLKAQLQAKDTTICKLKEHIKSMRENDKEEKVKHDMDEIETINIELEHSVAKLLSENKRLHKEIEHFKKSMENADLKGQIQEKVFVTTTLQNKLRKLKGKNVLDNASTITNATTIAPGMFKLDLDPLGRLKSATSASRSQPTGNKKNDRISQTPSSNMKNKVEVQRSGKKAKIVESKNANNSEPNHSWGSNATDVPSSSSLVMDSKVLGTVRFRNDQIAKILGYGDYHLGNIIISRVYYVEGLGHNLFSVGQSCDTDFEVAFWKNTCFIQNLKGVDLLSRSRDTNLYTISLDDILKTSLICLLSKASKTKSWLWHRQLSHLNFDTLNKLAKDGLARGILKLKFKKDHLCSACALGKSKKSSHQPKAEDTNQEKLYLPEFVNQTLREFYENVGITHQTSVTRTF
ncbi:retrovirus-related pol polyprotein from transposon TNT 1-94 [Tanacetum coccineum]|uniref:Retrovirus-related pol polyprotein from transposon TNT 1-94 n=1 Tax=Tanacetum coccineum TaxID=301880 RepID=A0ABQ5A1R6_9ASTR